MEKKKKRILCIIAIVLAVILIALAAISIVSVHLIRQNFGRGDYIDRSRTAYYQYVDFEAAYPRENLQFSSGENTLQGYIYGADNDRGLLVFAHGIGSGHEVYCGFLTQFVDAGWRVFTYDATGSGNSEGEGSRGLVQSVLDLDAALTYAEGDSRLNSLPVFVMGHSWGGFAAAAILGYDHDIAASASISGYAYPVDMLVQGAEDFVGETLSPLFRPFAWGYNQITFGADAGRNAVDAVNSGAVPLLVIHGGEDKTIPRETLGIYGHSGEITNPNVQYVPIDGKYCGHSNILYSDAANDYAAEFNAEFDKLREQYPDGMPADVRAEAIAKANQPLLNQPNAALYQTIETFFTSYLPAA